MTSPAAATDTNQGRRYRIKLPSGQWVEYTGCNSVLSALDRPALNTWKLKLVAAAVANDESLQELARVDSWAAVRSCLDTSSYEADLGTAVHNVTAALDLGLPVTDDMIPPSVEVSDVEPYLVQWQLLKEDHAVELVLVERTIYNERYGFAGTLDRLCVVPAISPLPLVGDIKTGKGIWPDVALQLAAYAHGEALWDPHSEQCSDLPPMERSVGAAFHLAPDHYEVVPVRLEDAWRAFQVAPAIFQWSAFDSRRALDRPLPAPTRWPW